MERTKELLRIVTLADETFAVLMERLWAHYHAPLGTNINFEHTYRRADGTSLSLTVALGKPSDRAHLGQTGEDTEKINGRQEAKTGARQGTRDAEEKSDSESEEEVNSEGEEEDVVDSAEEEEGADGGPSVGQKRSFKTAFGTEEERHLVCSKCRGYFPKSKFSQKQLRRMEKRKCKDCTTFQFPARSNVAHKKMKPQNDN